MHNIAILIIFILSAMPSYGLPSPGRPSGNNIWWCTIGGELSGNSNHFLLFGRDAWEGRATMSCRGPKHLKNLVVRVGFYSKLTGVGANEASLLKYKMTLWTTISPNDFNLHATIPGLNDGSSVHWQIVDQQTELTGTIWPSSLKVLGDSLSLGTLYIQPLTQTEI